jgi:hypothetical protein
LDCEPEAKSIMDSILRRTEYVWRQLKGLQKNPVYLPPDPLKAGLTPTYEMKLIWIELLQCDHLEIPGILPN